MGESVVSAQMDVTTAISGALSHFPPLALTVAGFFLITLAGVWKRQKLAQYLPSPVRSGMRKLAPYGWPVAAAIAVVAAVYFLRDVERLRAVPHLSVEPPVSQPSAFRDGVQFSETLLPVVNWPLLGGEHVPATNVHAEMRSLLPGGVHGLGPLRWSDVAQVGNGAAIARDIETTNIAPDNKARMLSLFMRTPEGDAYITNSFAVVNAVHWQRPELKIPFGHSRFDVRICALELTECLPVIIDVEVTKDAVTATLGQ